MKNYALHLPDGVKDYIGDEAALKEWIQNKVKNVFRTNSYNLIETPTFEYLNVFTLGEESFQQSSLYHLVSREGELMTLRSDMTRSIARVIGVQKAEINEPQRFSYLANSFRYPKRYQGKLHEFTQAGIELIGNKSLEADAEVIKVAVTCLKGIGVSDFTVHIGSSKFLAYFLYDLGLGDEESQAVFTAIENKDAVRLKNILKGAQVDNESLELLLTLMQCSGQINLLRSVQAKMSSSRAKDALMEMEQLYRLLEDYGVSDQVTFDFSVMSYGQYYTGMMFQIFSLGIGSALVEGGRYDHLLSKFGKNLPAVGFGMHINSVLQGLLKQEDLPNHRAKKTLAVSEPSVRKICLKISDQLREKDLIVENSLTNDITQALEYANKVGIPEVLYFKENDKVAIYHLEEQRVEEKAVSEVFKEGKYEADYICLS